MSGVALHVVSLHGHFVLILWVCMKKKKHEKTDVVTKAVVKPGVRILCHTYSSEGISYGKWEGGSNVGEQHIDC